MTIATLRTGTLSYVLASKPAKVYNNPATVQVGSAAAAPAYCWISLASLPADAQVASPVLLQLVVISPLAAASRTWTVKPAGTFKASTLTFNKQPTVGATSVTLTTTGALAVGAVVSIDVTTIVQAMRAGTIAASGYFQVTVSGGTVKVGGFGGSKNKPQLVVPYDTTTPAPENVIPNGGAVGTRTPIVSWDPWAAETGQQVQLASDSGFTSIVFDSGQVNVVPGQYDITGNGSGYQLPAGGTHVFVRARRNGPLGWSPWSPVAETWFTALPAVAFTSPGATTGDGTPPTVITTTGGSGAVRSTRYITRAAGTSTIIDDSGPLPGAVLSYTPATGLSVVGTLADLEVRVTDSETRTAVRNCPVYGSAVRTWQLVQTASTPPSDLQVMFASLGAPWATLTWSWTAVPDEWLILRDGVTVARVAGPDVVSGGSGSAFRWVDYTASAQTSHTWSVVVLTNGNRGTASNTVTVTPPVKGIFLVDVDTGEEVQLLGKEEVDGDFPATLFTSSPIGRGWTSVREVDRQAGTYNVSGAIDGGYGRLPQATRSTLEAIVRNQADRRLRLAFATVNVPVSLHSVVPTPVRAGSSENRQRWKVTYTAVVQGGN